MHLVLRFRVIILVLGVLGMSGEDGTPSTRASGSYAPATAADRTRKARQYSRRHLARSLLFQLGVGRKVRHPQRGMRGRRGFLESGTVYGRVKWTWRNRPAAPGAHRHRTASSQSVPFVFHRRFFVNRLQPLQLFLLMESLELLSLPLLAGRRESSNNSGGTTDRVGFGFRLGLFLFGDRVNLVQVALEDGSIGDIFG